MSERKVQLFVTCLVDSFYPDVAEAVVRLLEGYGCTVEFPTDQTCCGQPAYNTGVHHDAGRMAEHTVRVLDPTEGTIVVPSGSCADMMIHHSPDLVGPDLEAAARRVADRVREFSVFLYEDLGITEIDGLKLPGSAVYHPSCHGFRNLGIRHQPEALTDSVITRVELSDAEICCGFGGLFAIEMPEISQAMMNDKLRAIGASGAETLVGIDVSCLMHLSGGLKSQGKTIEVCHLAQLLEKSLDRLP